MTERQVGPLMGILFIVLVIAAVIVGGETPGTDDSAEKIVSFYRENDTEQAIASWLLALACVAFLFFLAPLRRRLRAAAGDEGRLSTVAVLGGVMIVAGASIFAGLTVTLADAADDLPQDAVLTLNALNSDMFFPIAIGAATFDLAVGLAVVRHGGLPRALGWLALLLGVLGLTPVAFFTLIATAIVIVWASVALARTPHHDHRAGSDEPYGGEMVPL